MICNKCGEEIMDEAVICPKCGCYTENYNPQVEVKNENSVSSLKKVAKVFMIIGTILMGLYIIPLAWTIPMLINFNCKLETNEKISVGFKVCVLLFVSTIAGILLLCDKD